MTFRTNAIQIAKNYSKDGLFVSGSIPGKKLSAALTNFPIDTTDEIFCLIDTTVFGSCKNGMAFGLKGIYWSNDWTIPSNDSFLSWDDLVFFKNQIHTKIMGDLIVSPGNTISFSGSNVKNKEAMNLTLQLIESYVTTSDVKVNNQILPQYIITLLKIASIYAAQDDVNDNVIDLCLEFIKYEDQVTDKEAAISILQENIENLSKITGVMKKLQANKMLAEIQKHTYTEEEKGQINILIKEFQLMCSNKLVIELT